MVTGQIAIDADVLNTHARKVSQLADEVSTAIDAVNSINLGGGAFGVLCAWMVPPAQIASSIVGSHVRETRTMLHRTDDELRGAARDFTIAEDAHVSSLHALREALG